MSVLFPVCSLEVEDPRAQLHHPNLLSPAPHRPPAKAPHPLRRSMMSPGYRYKSHPLPSSFFCLPPLKASWLLHFAPCLCFYRCVCWTALPSQQSSRPRSRWRQSASTCKWTATHLRVRISRCCHPTHVTSTLNWTWRSPWKSWVSTRCRRSDSNICVQCGKETASVV